MRGAENGGGSENSKSITAGWLGVSTYPFLDHPNNNIHSLLNGKAKHRSQPIITITIPCHHPSSIISINLTPGITEITSLISPAVLQSTNYLHNPTPSPSREEQYFLQPVARRHHREQSCYHALLPNHLLVFWCPCGQLATC